VPWGVKTSFPSLPWYHHPRTRRLPCRAVRDRNGKLTGVVVLKLKGEVIDRVCLDVSKQTAQGFAVVIDANEVIISHPDPKQLYHSIGTLSPEALKQIDPKLQYGVERIESAVKMTSRGL